MKGIGSVLMVLMLLAHILVPLASTAHAEHMSVSGEYGNVERDSSAHPANEEKFGHSLFIAFGKGSVSRDRWVIEVPDDDDIEPPLCYEKITWKFDRGFIHIRGPDGIFTKAGAYNATTYKDGKRVRLAIAVIVHNQHFDTWTLIGAAYYLKVTW